LLPDRTIAPHDLPGEFMMNALRLNEGVSAALFTERTGLPLAAIEKSALAARRAGLLEASRRPAAPDPAGRRFPQPPAGIISRKFRDIVNWRTIGPELYS
jgi:coproporphyrinogen III oxidase-like Fe-S oxidoreductase